jgi:hypothetical protein
MTTALTYSGRHRRHEAPLPAAQPERAFGPCRYGFEGCEGAGEEMAEPYELEIHEQVILVIACGNCGHELAWEV